MAAKINSDRVKKGSRNAKNL
ncbi:MAG: hypothetical protein RLZZ503_58, partial [Actinomycetota bacterium]